MLSTIYKSTFVALVEGATDATHNEHTLRLSVHDSTITEAPMTTASETIRPHACPANGCVKTFRRRSTLNEHIRTHSGEKTFCCPVASCQRRFSTSGNLSRHKRAQHAWLDTPLECLVDDCGCTFASDRKLERHMAMVHFSASAHSCPVRQCGRAFSTAGNLRRHLKQHHGETCDGSASYIESTPRSHLTVQDRVDINTQNSTTVNDFVLEPLDLLWSAQARPIEPPLRCSNMELIETLVSLFD